MNIQPVLVVIKEIRQTKEVEGGIACCDLMEKLIDRIGFKGIMQMVVCPFCQKPITMLSPIEREVIVDA